MTENGGRFPRCYSFPSGDELTAPADMFVV